MTTNQAKLAQAQNRVELVEPSIDSLYPKLDINGELYNIVPPFSAIGNVIDGSDDNDVIVAPSGEYIVKAAKGNDIVNAGEGNDVVFGEGGNDVLLGDDFTRHLAADSSGHLYVDFTLASKADFSLAKAYNPDGSEAKVYVKNDAYGVLGTGESGNTGQIGFSYQDDGEPGDRAGASEVLSVSLGEHSYAAKISIERLFQNEGSADGTGKENINEVGIWTVLREGVVIESGYFTVGEFNQATLEFYNLDPAQDNLKVLQQGDGDSSGLFVIEPQDVGFTTFDEIQFSAASGQYINNKDIADSSDFFVKDVEYVELESNSLNNADSLFGGNDDDVLLGGVGNDLLIGDDRYDFEGIDGINLLNAKAYNPNAADAKVWGAKHKVGVDGNPETGNAKQLGFSYDENTRQGESESLTYDLGSDHSAARISIDRLYANEADNGANEVGKWTALSNGVVIATGYFTAYDLDDATLQTHGLSLSDNIKLLNNDNGSSSSGFFDITLDDTNGIAFDQIEFSAAQGVYEISNGAKLDSSDYFIREIKVIENDSTASKQEGSDWLDGGENDDKIQGGYGNDVLIGGSGNDILLGDYAPANDITEATVERITDGTAYNPDGSQADITITSRGFGVAGNPESGQANQIGFSFKDNGQAGDAAGQSEVLSISVDNDTMAADVAVSRLFANEGFDGTHEVGVWTVFDQGKEIASGYFTAGEISSQALAAHGIDPATDNIKVLENGNGNHNGDFTITPSDTGNAKFDEIQFSAASGTFDKNAFGAQDSSDYYLNTVKTYQADDLLIGGTGNDVLAGGHGLDVVAAGDGHDVIFDNGNDFVDGGNGFDVVIAHNASFDSTYELSTESVEHDVDFAVTSNSKLQNVEMVVGSDNKDTLLLDLDTVKDSAQSIDGTPSNAFFAVDIEKLQLTQSDFTFDKMETLSVADITDPAVQAQLNSVGVSGNIYSYTFVDGNDTVSVISDVQWDDVV
ncbi:hypothetical protein BIY22_07815 [Vibrio panuliri]|uniref:Calcium-binding protein n=1 Tax=Vibrio panuliri TaxID=1381081 RepID=A0A1Q9HEJ2_9VIBR|nr:hypothetical protein [Vibrio panuliri]OLQ88070.1 hypothetical protein BIY22_07815 [Vibrio panuliri]